MVNLPKRGWRLRKKVREFPGFTLKNFMIMGVGSNFYMDLKFIKVYQEGTQKWLIHPF